MNFQELATAIVQHIGGKENVKFVTHCSTRLRFELVDDTVPNKAALERMSEIVGVTNKAGQYQLIIGADVGVVHREVLKLLDIQNNQKKTKTEVKWYTKVLDIITGSITPIIPLICGSGLIAAFLALFTSLKWIDTASETYYILNMLGNVGLYTLPIFLGFSVAKKLDTNPYYGALLGAMMLHPNLTALVSQGVSSITYFGLPMKIVNYGSSMVPIFLSVICLKYVDMALSRIIPKSMRIFIQPACILLIVGSITLWVFGPIGVIVGEYLADAILAVNGYAAWAAMALLGILLPWLTLTGMHLSLLPVAFIGLATVGYDALLFPAALAHNLAAGGAGLAVALKTKNAGLRSLALSNTFTVIMGISEPILFTVHMKLKKPMFAVSIGGGLAGLFMGLMGVKAIAPGASVLTITAFIGATFQYAIIGAIIAFVGAFIAAWLIGFDDSNFEDVILTEPNKMQGQSIVKETVQSPIQGKIIPLHKLSDAAFVQLGIGLAVQPENGMLYAPISGTVRMVFTSKHAIGLVSEQGMEVLVHVGIDTVKMQGKGFELKVREGQKVHLGDLLMEFDQDLIRKEGYDPTVIVVITNQSKYLDILETDHEQVRVGETLLTAI